MATIKFKFLIVLLFVSTQIQGQQKALHSFKATTIDGKEFDFSTLKGKKVLIVNIATECSLSPQLKKLQELYMESGSKNFEIIAFPCNDFGKQEPGDNSRIKQVCSGKYNITFQLMQKITIKGENCHPVYKWLTSSSENGTMDSKVTWNYQKFLIDENGKIVDSLAPIISPKNNQIIKWLKE